MRVLRYLFFWLSIVLLIVIASFFVAREALLYWGISTVKQSLLQLQRAGNQNSYQIECKRRGLSSGGQEILQLRFLSSTEYVLEAHCSKTSRESILIERQQLPPFVEKVPGRSGIVWDTTKSGIELEVFRQIEKQMNALLFNHGNWVSRSRRILVDNRIVYEDQELPGPEFGPVTSCNGYGYECCQDVSQYGVGDRLSGITDCEKSCYSACVSRPVILSFTSNPFFDLKTRTIEIASGATVEFVYVADEGQANSLTALFDFGDGKTEQVTGTAKALNHKFTCATAECQYHVRLRLKDNWGIESADTPVSTMTVKVHQ
ncbi:MAG: PKD domain-containing protein [Microgenomates group bacterium]